MSSKDTNPKDAIGITKVPISTVPIPVILEVGLAMLEGACKYRRHNYRVAGVRASVYYDAVMARHMPAWWEGEDNDPDSGICHVTKAIASLVVLRDAMIRGKMIDDRPPSTRGFVQALNAKTKEILERYKDVAEHNPPYTHADTGGDQYMPGFPLPDTGVLVQPNPEPALKAVAEITTEGFQPDPEDYF